MRHRRGTRGAALVEYSILAGLISVVAITSVSSLGRQVSQGFGTAAEQLTSAIAPAGSGDIAEEQTAEEAIESVWGEPMPTGEFTSWTVAIDGTNSGDPEMPAYITRLSKWNWVINISALPPAPPENNFYWAGTYSTSGSMTPRNGYANPTMGYGIESLWQRPGTDYEILRGAVSPVTAPSATPGVTTEYVYSESRSGGIVPVDATGIVLDLSFFSCGYQATCVADDIDFEIRIYAE